jgi:hypothetical protein
VRRRPGSPLPRGVSPSAPAGRVRCPRRCLCDVVPAEQVAGRFFSSGRVSHSDVQEFMKAAGDRSAAVRALQDFAVNDLRRVAVSQDGKLDAVRWRTWMKSHGNALRTSPELENRLNRVQRGQIMVDHLGDRRNAAIQAFEGSEANKFLDRDPLAGLLEPVTYRNPDNGYCVLRVKVHGFRDLVTP